MERKLLGLLGIAAIFVAAMMFVFSNTYQKTTSLQKFDGHKMVQSSLAKIHNPKESLKADSEEDEIAELKKSEKYDKGKEFKEEEEENKFDEPDKFASFESAIRTPMGATSPNYPKNYRMIELNKAVEKRFGVSLKTLNGNFRNIQDNTINWKERGPGNVAGRTRGLIVDPDDITGNTWFAGSVGGGVWKTTDAGKTWTDKTPALPNLATTVLAMAPSNHDIIYVGTGEGFYNTDAINGDGIFKSTDHGETWTQLTSTKGNLDFQDVNRIIVDPSDANTLYTCANVGFFSRDLGSTSGIYESTDGGDNWSNIYTSSSRVQQLLANPDNFNTMYATVNGLGVIKSTDMGATWDTTAGIITNGRVEIAIAPTDTTRMYAAVESATGSDLFVSDDAGDTWTLVNDASGTNPNWLNGQGWYDNTIVVNPYDKDTAYVGGVNVYKVAMAPGKDTVETYSANITNYTFLSIINWGGSMYYGGIGKGSEFLGSVGLNDTDYVSVEIRFGAGLTQKAHRFVRDASTGNYIYKDYVTVPFQVWDVTHNKQIMASFRDWNDNGVFDLINYDANNLDREYLFINADPYDANNPDPTIAQNNGFAWRNIYSMWPILADGATWDANNIPNCLVSINHDKTIAKLRNTTQLTNWYVTQSYPYTHADHHNLVTIPVDQATHSFRILDANDGGASISNDGGVNWTQITSYQTTQFYGVDKNPVADQYIGGLQDNGTWYSNVDPAADSSYHEALGGDGFDVAWKYDDPNQMLGSIYYDRIYKSIDGGNSWNSATNGLDDANNNNNAPFITKIATSKLDPDLVFATSSGAVWRSDNFATSWTKTFAPISGGSSFGAVEISQNNPQVVWAGAYMTSTEHIAVSTDGGLSFANTNNYGNLGRITGLATSPVDDSTAYALFSMSQSPKILRTTDLGQTWTDISGFGSGTSSTNGFPDVAVYCLLQMPTTPDTLWAGTEIGLFQSTDNGANWALAGNGLPNVSIWQMRIVGNQIVVATHGRGIWSVDAPWLANYQYPTVTKSPRLNLLAQSPSGALSIPTSLRSAYDSSFVNINGVNILKVEGNSSAKDSTFNIPVTQAQSDTVMIVSYKDNHPYMSATRMIDVKLLQSAQNYYVNDFNTSSNDFDGSGFSIGLVNGFKDGAIQSQHPYSNGNNYIYQLLVPIKVASDHATLSYDDVAIVEPGDPGTKFGDSKFWDYVIVEGTIDGINWVPLLDGYDSRANAKWLTAYNNKIDGADSMYVNHSVNLLDHFSAGQTILIRFRLMADAYTNGWGWAIDNLSIQEKVVPVELASFSANSVEGKINLTWKTATEKNNSGFEIQRSLNKKDFKKIGYIKGNGTSTEIHSYSFVDKSAPTGKNYYRLKQIDFDGTSSYSKIIEAVQALPTDFSLSQNYPNPFNPSTIIKFQLPVKERVTLTIYNTLGEKIKTLVDDIKDAGYYKITWNARNEYNHKVASGVYVYRIQAGKFVKSKKMMLMK